MNALGSLGFSLPTPAYLLGGILFSILGMAAYRFGKTSGRPMLKWIGGALMVYPYFIDQTWILYVVGIGLTTAAFLYSKEEP